MLTLRPYQKRAIMELYYWLERNPGHPCLVLPTGSGKSVIVAEICRDAITSWPGTKILMLTARKELIEQNRDKLRAHWPNAPIGVYSAAMGRREIGEPITFAGILSVRSRASMLGHIDLCLVDEAHEISHNDEGSYRYLIRELLKINPSMRVVGLTATPFRLGHGLITDKPAIFDDLIEPVSILELQAAGYLAKVVSKNTDRHLTVDGVHKRGGDYIESELQAAVDTDLNNEQAVAEIIRRAGERKAWLIFCSGVEHSHHIRDILKANGVEAATVTGDTPKSERERILADFKSGKIRAITNANILTTGFDHPDIDLIAMLRPTCSPGLYMQMAGRGLRLKSHGGDCLVLDFAGNVAMHGPITTIRTPKKVIEGGGVAPAKICPECEEIIAIQCKTCPECGYVFPIDEKADAWKLRNDDISGTDLVNEIELIGWEWVVQKSRKSGKDMVVVSYYPRDISHEPIREYLCVWHDGYAGLKAIQAFNAICKDAGLQEIPPDIADMNRAAVAPKRLKYLKDGKYFRVISREWEAVPF
jgi:DNA repair protein RadD